MPRKPHKIESVVFTATEFASLLGVGKSTITKWRKEGLPTTPTGQIPLKAGLRWYLDRELVAAGGESGSEHLERWRRIRADLAQLELDKASGKLVLMCEVSAFWADRLTFAKQQLMGTGHSLAPSLVGRDAVEICQRIDDHGRWVCEQLFKEWMRADGYTEAEIEKMVDDHYNP